MRSQVIGENTSAVEVLNISPHGFWLYAGGGEHFLPFEKFPWFREARISEILNVELLHASHLHWPELDVDLTLGSIEDPDSYPLVYS